MADQDGRFPVVDNAGVAPIFASRVLGAGVDSGMIVLTLGDVRDLYRSGGEIGEPDQGPKAYVTCRLALTPAAAFELASTIPKLLATISNARQMTKDRNARVAKN